MDSSNSNLFKLEDFNRGQLTHGIFVYQKALMESYIMKGSLPPIENFDISTRDNQALIRNLVGYVVEELAEADEQLDQMKHLFLTENYTLGTTHSALLEHSKKALEELADALHFLIEILVYLKVEDEDLLLYLKSLPPEFTIFIGDDALSSAHNVAAEKRITNDHSRMVVFNAYSIPLAVKDMGYFPLSKMSFDIFSVTEAAFWRATKSLSLMRNLLKKKEWREAEVESNASMLQERAAQAFLSFCQLLDILQVEPKAIYKAYEDKNLINQERILNKY
jgi:hypothetical protein